MNLSSMIRLPSNLTANAVEKVEKLDDQTVVVKKILYGADNTEVVVSQQKLTKTALQTQISAVDIGLANYKDPKWIGEQILQLQATKSDLQIKLDLLD